MNNFVNSMTNSDLRTFAMNNKGDIAAALRKYYRNDPILLKKLRTIASKLICWPMFDDIVGNLEKIDNELEILANSDCADDIRPNSYKLIVELRVCINKILDIWEK